MAIFQNLLKPEETPLSTKVVRNGIYNALRLLLLAPLPFLVIPIFLKALGPSGYGTWAGFLAINGATSLADFGLVTSLSRHVAESYALKDFPSLARIINTGFALYLAVASVFVGLLWLGSPFLVTVLFKGSLLSISELSGLWRVLLALMMANILTMAASSAVTGLQRMDVTTGLSSFSALSNAGLSILFLHWGWGVRGILYGYLATASTVLFLYLYVLRRLLPEIGLRLSNCRWAEAKDILSFSVQTYVNQIAVAVHNQIEKIYLATFAGVVAVGWYDISSDLALKLRGIPSLVLAPIMPAASELQAQDDQKRLSDLYFRTHKYLAFAGVPLVAFFVFVSRRFVELWVGPSLSFIAIPLSALLIVNFINLTTGPGYLIMIAKGLLKPGLYSAVMGLAFNLSLSLVLIKAFGFSGAVIGTSLSLVLASAFFVYLSHRQSGCPFPRRVFMVYLKPLLCSLTVLAALSLFSVGAQSTWIRLVFLGGLFAVSYVSLTLVAGFFDAFDLAILEGILRLRVMRRTIPDA